MEKFQWIAVVEMLVAMTLVFILWSFLSGPCHRMAFKLHGMHPHGHSGHKEDYDDDDKDK
jgi:hypothetical protein